MRRIAVLFSLVLLARAEDPALGPDTVVRRVHDLAAFQDDAKLLAVVLNRVRAAVAGTEIRVLESGGIEIWARLATQLRVERELREARAEAKRLITVEVRFVELKEAPAVARVAADKVEAFLEERRAGRISSHTFRCRNFGKAGVEVTRDVPYVPDFDIECGGGELKVTNPRTEVAQESWTAGFEPIALGDDLRLTAEFSITDVELKEFISTLAPFLKTSWPETRSRTFREPIECKPDTFAVIGLHGSLFALVRATAGPR